MTDREQLLALAHRVREAATCTECRVSFNSTRVLPKCLHTFCRDCLQHVEMHFDVERLRYKLPCPKCSRESWITDGNVDKLMKNYFAEKLLDITNPVLNTIQGCTSRECICEFVRHLNDIAECPVCRELYIDARMLPCLHTFCTRCLQSCRTNNWSWAPSKCPLCRREYDDDVNALPLNEMLSTILASLSEPETQKLISRYLDPEFVPDSQREVAGVAELCSRLYVLSTQSKLVSVYMTQAPYSMIDQIELHPGLEPTDLAAAPTDKCLYVADVAEDGCIWRIVLEEKMKECAAVELVYCGREELGNGQAGEECSDLAAAQAVGGLDSCRSREIAEHETGTDECGNKLTPLSENRRSEEDASYGQSSEAVNLLQDDAQKMDETQCTPDGPDEESADISSEASQATGTEIPDMQGFIQSLLRGFRGNSEQNILPPAELSIETVVLGKPVVENMPLERRASPSTNGQAEEDGLAAFIRGLLERTGVMRSIAERKDGMDAARPLVWQLSTGYKIERWISGIKAVGMSVGSDGQIILVTECGRLVIYRSDGQQVADHTLPVNIQKPRHAVFRASTGSFVVSHSSEDGSAHGISELLTTRYTTAFPLSSAIQTRRTRGVNRSGACNGPVTSLSIREAGLLSPTPATIVFSFLISGFRSAVSCCHGTMAWSDPGDSVSMIGSAILSLDQ